MIKKKRKEIIEILDRFYDAEWLRKMWRGKGFLTGVDIISSELEDDDKKYAILMGNYLSRNQMATWAQDCASVVLDLCHSIANPSRLAWDSASESINEANSVAKAGELYDVKAHTMGAALSAIRVAGLTGHAEGVKKEQERQFDCLRKILEETTNDQ